MKPVFTNQQNCSSDCSCDLLQRCMNGDHSAQLQVYKLCYKKVFRICMQIVNDPVVAEKLMQESFLLAFENMNAYMGDMSFTSWTKRFIYKALGNCGKDRPIDQS